MIEEFVSPWLTVIPSDFGRLAHVSGLRDVTTGRYYHPRLEEVYSGGAVHQAWHLRRHFASMGTPVDETPPNLRDLFLTKVGAILRRLVREQAAAATA